MISRMNWRRAATGLPLTLASLDLSNKFSTFEKGKTDYDVAVFGGGSGGISFSFEAQNRGLSTVLFDYVIPSPHGTKWGVGGTCVNVGCIPKKLMHQAAILGESLMDSHDYGWDLQQTTRQNKDQLKKAFSWQKLVLKINMYIKSLNFGYKGNLQEKGIKYINAFATLVDSNTVLYSSNIDTIRNFIQSGKVPEIKGNSDKVGILKVRSVVIATGGKPTYLQFEGNQLAITSDDIFWKKTPPGRTLVVGGGYVAVEIAGFLSKFGFPTSLMTRGDYLRSFDRDIVKIILDDLKQKRHINVIEKSLPKRMWRQRTQIVVEHCKTEQGKQCTTSRFDTVLLAVGRNANTQLLNLDRVGIQTDKNNKKIKTDQKQVEFTGVEGVYAIGDVVEGVPELTGTVQKSALFLARRIAHRLGASPMSEQEYSASFIDFKDFPTTIFTPMEYSVCGMSEEQAVKQFGKDNIEVYHSKYLPLEQSILDKYDQEGNDYKNYSYIKVITDSKGLVCGLHYAGPNAGEVMQGYAVAMRMGLTKYPPHCFLIVHVTQNNQEVRARRPKEGVLRMSSWGLISQRVPKSKEGACLRREEEYQQTPK